MDGRVKRWRDWATSPRPSSVFLVHESVCGRAMCHHLEAIDELSEAEREEIRDAHGEEALIEERSTAEREELEIRA